MRDPLLPLLPGPQDADRPWLICYRIDERVELTGHVLSMWMAKIAGLITAESVQGDGVHVGLPPHWRTVAWACGTWMAGRSVLLGSSEEISAAGLVPELSVAFTPEDLCDEAEAQVLVPPASLALRWPGELPALVLDGAADLMHYPDHFTPVSAAADLMCLSDLGDRGVLSSDPAAPAAQGGPAGTSPSDPRPTSLTRAQLVAQVEASCRTAGADNRSASRAALVRHADTAQMLQEVLVAWRSGRTAVILTPEAGDDIAATAIRQEGITEWTGGAQPH
ncbi:TIGR03089 family protein [Actinomyces stomatis]|uniref:TIGR03089 family protein n=1 Tax=Actinomyces stomatis TaxID=3050227 RepID=UPI002852BE87|nr:TIGR03089 family protein [Actinomyces sp. PK606]